MTVKYLLETLRCNKKIHIQLSRYIRDQRCIISEGTLSMQTMWVCMRQKA